MHYPDKLIPSSKKGRDWTRKGVDLGSELTSQGDIVARIVAWLTQHQPENGKAPKKMLAANARAEFGSGYTERAFNEAYREVYQRRRGRPRAPENKQMNADLFI
jgi:hypothetical protein